MIYVHFSTLKKVLRRFITNESRYQHLCLLFCFFYLGFQTDLLVQQLYCQIHRNQGKMLINYPSCVIKHILNFRWILGTFRSGKNECLLSLSGNWKTYFIQYDRCPFWWVSQMQDAIHIITHTHTHTETQTHTHTHTSI